MYELTVTNLPRPVFPSTFKTSILSRSGQIPVASYAFSILWQNFWIKLPTDSTWTDFNWGPLLRSTDTDKAKLSLWNCQSFKSEFGDDRFLLLHYFGDKFSVGAVNFHSVGRLIVGYLTERSVWRNFDNSEHLLGLTEGQKSVPNFTGDLH